jgi:hypothetical protein
MRRRFALAFGCPRLRLAPFADTRIRPEISRQLSTESPGLARHGEASPLKLAQPRAGPQQRRLWTPVGR